MWHLRQADDAAVGRLAAELQLPPAVARVAYLRVLQATGSADPQSMREFLAARDDLGSLRQPVAVPAMQKAVARIRQAIEAGERIGLYGDYDCDGVTSAAILYRYLSRGLKAQVQPRLPDRFRDGYGIHPVAVEQLSAQGCTVIITCDNGVSAHAAADKAKELGVDLIVTDHHHVPPTLPDAFAIVHPQVAFPEFKDLCGAGVAFLLVVALEGGLTARLESFLDLVAMGTIADMVPLTGPNRALVWAGLQQMRNGKAHPGTKALAEVSRIAMAQASTRDLGFTFGPRLNAAGRLETPDIGFRLLVTNDRNEARALAEQLDMVNNDRRELNAELEARVLARLEAEVDVDRTPFIVIGGTDYHHGLIGLVAGRIAERYRSPVLLLSADHDGSWRGSGRAPQGLHLYEALAACSEHLIAFGGHAQAAGCRVRADGLDGLRDALNAHLARVGWTRPEGDRWLDAELPFAQADGALLDALDLLEPCGQQNPAPALGLLGARVVGVQVRSGRHLFMQLDDGDTIAEVIAWGQAEHAPQVGDRLNLQYRPQWNTFRGETKIQRIVEKDFEVVPGTVAPLERLVKKAPATADVEGPLNKASTTTNVDELMHETSASANDEGLTNQPPARANVESLMKQAPGAVDPREVGAGASSSRRIEDARKTGFRGNPSARGVALYAHQEPPAGIWIAPGDAPPEGLAMIVCLDVPADLATWRALLRAAATVVLAWRGLDGAVLGADDLVAVYQHLAGRNGLELFTAITSAPVPLADAQAAVRIFREAGLLVQSPTGWCLLAPPEGPVSLTQLDAFRKHETARRFREQLAEATPETALALADLVGEREGVVSQELPA